MKIVSLIQDENLSFKVSQQLPLKATQQLDLYFSIPDDMGINAITLPEDTYFYSSLKSHLAYFSQEVHLPLVRSRFISQTKGEESDYRSNLNLFSYQFRLALDNDLKQSLQEQDIDAFYQGASELLEQTQNLLKKLRRYTPPDQKLSSYFENVDNYLSWYTEQSFLNLLANSPKSSEQTSIRDKIFDLCRSESKYREDNNYNSQITLDDPNRITNKMRLLQRLSEFGVVFKKETSNLNNHLKRLVRGTVTAVIMGFMMAIVLNSRTIYTEVTLLLILFLGLLYGLREVFRDDLMRIIWRWIEKGRPKWLHIFHDSLSKVKMAQQTIWLEYINEKDLPEKVDGLLQKRRQQNKQSAQLLHFRCETKITAKNFKPGFEEVQNQLFFNMTPFVRFLKKGEGRLFSFEGNKVSNQGVERRYQMNLVLVQKNMKKEEFYQRYKITINRSKIVNIETMESEQNFDE
ncbi:hypothetical protein [Thalassotalea profundi]|uniref:Uncharacterized protein n=1 Tax=Thalassotalea profundi TaxID=2036687 RepID=A0ABQ3IRX8_9GAMM|nr:hypothetical protein [Thalassotalea profundi]GHE91761.1 hypothetical protein GCM10011501_21480 [Thalassotalea profundi]